MQTNLNGTEAAPITRQMGKKEQHCFDKLIWAITGPIIVPPSAVGSPIPDNIRQQITIQRMIAVASREEKMATEAEAVWYISCASFDAPPDRDWCDIQMYLTRKYMKAIGSNPEEIDFLREPIILNEMQEMDLKNLREWIFKKSFEEVKRKCREQEKESNLAKEPISKETGKQASLLQMFG